MEAWQAAGRPGARKIRAFYGAHAEPGPLKYRTEYCDYQVYMRGHGRLAYMKPYGDYRAYKQGLGR